MRRECAERIVFVRDRDPEDGHDRVADELLDRPAVALDDPPQVFEVPPHARTQRLRIRRLAERGRADEIAEEHGDDLPLLARRLRGQRGAAGAAEPSVAGVLATAGRARRHSRSLRGLSRPKFAKHRP